MSYSIPARKFTICRFRNKLIENKSVVLHHQLHVKIFGFHYAAIFGRWYFLLRLSISCTLLFLLYLIHGKVLVQFCETGDHNYSGEPRGESIVLFLILIILLTCGVNSWMRDGTMLNSETE